MPEEEKVTPERLREIIDMFEGVTTFEGLKAVYDQLTPGELEDFEAYTQKLPGHVEPTPKKPVVPVVKPGLVIARTRYPKWWKELQAAAIDLAAAGTQTVIRYSPGNNIFLATIVIIVSGETHITFGFGVFGLSGAMPFGGENEPRGMVISMGESPTPCGQGDFTVTSDGADVTVGGFVSYYSEPA